jgi:hypothetical protein
VETYKLTSTVPISYKDSFLRIKEKEGLYKLMLRGLKTRITSNLIQGIFFSITWRLIQEELSDKI